MTDDVDARAVKIIEIMGVSTQSFEAAVEHAVGKAAESIAGITSVEVVRQSATVRDGAVVRYEVVVKLAFTVR